MIVKNLLVVGVVAGFATAAAAQDSKGSWSIGGRVRVDNAQKSTETEEGGVKSTGKESSVKLTRAQFSLTGSKDGHSLAITYYADQNLLYSAVLSHKFSDMITAHFGRMRVLSQSIENSYDDIDLHIRSLAKDHAPSNADGVRLDFAFSGDHSLSIQAVEGVETTMAGAEFEENGGLTSALQYRGNINGMIKPIVSYTQVRTSSRKSKDGQVDLSNGYQTQIGLGAQISTSGAVIDLEHDTGTMHKAKGSTGKDVKMTSTVAQVKYAIDKNTPFLKIISDATKKGETSDVGDVTSMQYAVGVEHALDDSCRLHAFYMSKADTTEKGPGAKDSKSTATGFNFGVTASM